MVIALSKENAYCTPVFGVDFGVNSGLIASLTFGPNSGRSSVGYGTSGTVNNYGSKFHWLYIFAPGKTFVNQQATILPDQLCNNPSSSFSSSSPDSYGESWDYYIDNLGNPQSGFSITSGQCIDLSPELRFKFGSALPIIYGLSFAPSDKDGNVQCPPSFVYSNNQCIPICPADTYSKGGGCRECQYAYVREGICICVFPAVVTPFIPQPSSRVLLLALRMNLRVVQRCALPPRTLPTALSAPILTPTAHISTTSISVGTRARFAIETASGKAFHRSPAATLALARGLCLPVPVVSQVAPFA